MANNMLTRAQVLKVLEQANVQFDAEATLTQLRPLYDKVIYELQAPATSTAATNVQPSAPATITAATDATAAASFQSNVQSNGQSVNTGATKKQTANTPAASGFMSTATMVNSLLPSELATMMLVDRGEWAEMRADLAEMRALRTENKILMEQLQQKQRDPVAPTSKLADVSAVETVVKKFTGDGNIEVKKWFDELEEVMVVLGFDERLRWVACRRMLGGTAAASVSANPVFSYEELKVKLIADFSRTRTVPEVYGMLANRRLGADEDIRRYVLEMQEIAAQAAIAEIEVVDFIIDGVRNASGDVGMLYGAQTIEELRPLLERYERKRTHRRQIV